MLAEALRRHAGDDRPDAVSLKLAPEASAIAKISPNSLRQCLI